MLDFSHPRPGEGGMPPSTDGYPDGVGEGVPRRVMEIEMAMQSADDSQEEVHPAAERPSAVVAAFLGAWERNNPDEIVQLFSDDAVWFDAYPANQFSGTEQIRTQLERYSRHLSNISIEVVHQAVVGNVVFQERVDRGLREGVPFEVGAVCVFTVRDGKIVENRDYWNPAAYIRRPGRENGGP